MRMEDHSRGSHAKLRPVAWIHHSPNCFCSLCDRLYSAGSNTFSLRASSSFFPIWPALLQRQQAGTWPPPSRASASRKPSPPRLSTFSPQAATAHACVGFVLGAQLALLDTLFGSLFGSFDFAFLSHAKHQLLCRKGSCCQLCGIKDESNRFGSA
jgi:hypothetical protein